MNRSENWKKAFCAALPGVISTFSSGAPVEVVVNRTAKIADAAEKLLKDSEPAPTGPHDFEQDV